MAICKDRLPPTQDIVLVWAACVFAVYGWAILAFFRRVPAWLFYLDSWDVIGIFAYTQVFALLESGIALGVIIFIGAILPARFFKDRFVAQGIMLVFLTAGWAIAAHYSAKASNLWSPKTLLIWLAMYLASIGGSYALLCRYERLEDSINSFANRLTVLLYVYIPVTISSIVIVILRNISGNI